MSKTSWPLTESIFWPGCICPDESAGPPGVTRVMKLPTPFPPRGPTKLNPKPSPSWRCRTTYMSRILACSPSQGKKAGTLQSASCTAMIQTDVCEGSGF